MAQAECLYCFSNPLRFSLIDRVRSSRFYGAVVTAPGADVTEYKEGSGARVPTFPSIGTAGFFANGVELEPVHRLLDVEIVRAGLCVDLEPGWQARTFSRSELVDRDQAHERVLPFLLGRNHPAIFVSNPSGLGGDVGSGYSTHVSCEPR